MSRFWFNWLIAWGWSIVAFGVVLMTGAFDATGGAVRNLLTMLGGEPVTMTAPLRFAVALMGAVTGGWGLTLLAAIRAANRLGDRAQPVWTALTVAVVGWYLVDSALSVATGFGLNAVSNTVYLAAYLLPVIASGVLGGASKSLSRA